MSAELDALERLAANYRSGVYRLSPTSLAVLFYATRFWAQKYNWRSSDPDDVITDVQWDTIQSYVDGLLYEVKNPMIGMIVPFMTESPPANVLTCDGSTYLRDEYPALYEALDPIFIVDADHFRVPDLRGRTVIGAGSGAGLTSRSAGDVGGEETHQLTESELASHTHTDTGHSHSIQRTITTLVLEPGEVPALTPVPIIPDYTGTSSANLTNTGGDDPHNNMQPFYALNYGVIAS